MMNNTYSLIISQSERAWSYQWARTLLALERRLNDDERQFYLRKYAINIAKAAAQESGADAEPSDAAAEDAAEEAPSGEQVETMTTTGRVAISGAAPNEQRSSRAQVESKTDTRTTCDDDDDDDEFVPALMIIKQMPFTRAERRRRLVGLWQVSALGRARARA